MQFGRSTSPWDKMLAPVFVGALFYLGARLGVSLSFEPGHITVFWPPNAFLLTALLLSSPRRWWLYLLAIIPAELAADIPAGFSWPVALGFAVANGLEALLAAWALRRFSKLPLRFDRLRQVLIYIAWAVVLAPMVGAIMAAIVSAMGIPDTGFWVAWYRWFLRDSLVHLTLTPAILAILTGDKDRFKNMSLNQRLEGGGLVLLLLIITVLAFGNQPGEPGNSPVLLYFPFPLLLWSAIRFGPSGSSSSTFLVALIAIWLTSNGRGPFTTHSPAENVLSLQAFLMVVAVSVLLLAALIRERERSEESLRQAHRLLERKFAERTATLSQEVVERQQVANELRESEERYRTLVEQTTDGISIVDQSGVIQFVNPAAELLFGRPKDELIGQNFGFPVVIDRNTEINILRAGGGATAELRVAATDWREQAAYLVSLRDITDRRKAEIALRESERQLREVLENIQLIALMVDQTGRITFANKFLLDLMGRSREEILDLNWIDQFIPSEHKAELVQFFRSILDDDQNWPHRHENPILVGPGQQRLIAWSNVLIRDLQGEIVGLTSIGEDITERRQMELALQESETRFRTLVTSMNDVIYMLDREQRHVGVYGNWVQEAGLTPDYFLNKTARDLFGEEAAAIHEAANERALAGENVVYEWSVESPEQTIIYYQTSLSPFRQDNSGEIVGIVGVGRDITLQKQVEQALRESEKKLDNVLGTIMSGVVVVDLNGQITYANRAAGEIMGIQRDHILNRYFSERAWRQIDELGRPFPIERLSLSVALTQEKEVEYLEHGIIDPGGHEKWLATNAAPLFDEQGRLYGAVASFQDISDLKRIQMELRQAKEEAEAASRAKSEFLAHMSHELRTPLNAILGYAQLFKEDNSLGSKQHEGIEVIHHSGEHLLHMINDILDLSKVEAGKMELYPKSVHLPHFFKMMADTFRIRAEQKGLNFAYHLDPKLPAGVIFDERRLRQVLLNLVSNAINYTSTGRVELAIIRLWAVEESAVQVRFQVNDTGPGIPDEKMEEVFAPFQRGEQANTGTGGTGLGLSISRQLVHMMGGELQIKSEVDRGSRFWFDLTLPLTDVQPSPEPRRAGPRVIGLKGTPRRVLVVDDRLENRRLLRKMLQPLGFVISEAVNGHEAIKNVSAELPDLMIIDLVMPVMNGFDLVRQIRQMNGGDRIVIFGVSASVGEDIRTHCLAVGCDEFIPKPIERAKLLEALQKHLHLEWIYKSTPAAPEQAGPESGPAFSLPPVDEVQTLGELAEIGAITGLERHLNRLSQMDVAYRPFVIQVKQLLDQFEFDKIIALINDNLKEQV
jgi:PAS domain S-box-containing protein